MRKPMPIEREAETVKFSIEGHDGYLIVGLYDDGTLGEIFVCISKEGSTLRGVFNAFSIAVSLGLQHGVPLRTYVDKFKGLRFEPLGYVDHAHIKEAGSIVDFVFTWLERRFLSDE